MMNKKKDVIIVTLELKLPREDEFFVIIVIHTYLLKGL